MAPADSYSPAGSSSYYSDTMYVGDGTWVSSKNTFLLPNLVGMNFETMQYNGMGNRFASLPQYHQIIKGHGILAAITFLLLVPAAILIAQFSNSSRFWALRLHIYLQILTIMLSTVVFTLGWFAVGPSRSFTNPHHGIGMAIYVLVLVQGLFGYFIYQRPRKQSSAKVSMSMMLHEWVGKATALLGLAQVALGLTLYGSPKYTFVLYALWMAILLIVFFNLKYRSRSILHNDFADTNHENTSSEDPRTNQAKRSSSPYSPVRGLAAVFCSKIRRRNSSTSRSEMNISKGRGSQIRSENYDQNDEKLNDRRKKSSGLLARLVQLATAAGIIGLGKDGSDKKSERKSERSPVVSQDVPSYANRTSHDESHVSEVINSPIQTREEHSESSSYLPGTSRPLNATELTTSGSQSVDQRDNYDSESFTEDSTTRPFRKEKKSPGIREMLLGFTGINFLGRLIKNRGKQEPYESKLIKNKETRDSGSKSKGKNSTMNKPYMVPVQERQESSTSMSDLSTTEDSEFTELTVKENIPMSLKPGTSPIIPAAHPKVQTSPREFIEMPPIPADGLRNLFQESNDSSRNKPEAHAKQQYSSVRKKGSEVASSLSASEATRLATLAEEERQKFRTRVSSVSTSTDDGLERSVSVKVKVHDDQNHITLRRLTREEAAAERDEKTAGRRWRRADSVSTISGINTAASHRRYRRSESETGRQPDYLAQSIQASQISTANPVPSVIQSPKESIPNNPIRDSKKNSHLSTGRGESMGSHETWSAMSPGNDEMGEAAAERRRRRRLERSQRNEGII